MKIAVVGPGAMGCLFAGLLKEAGHDLWILGRSAERTEQIARRGIRIEGIGGDRVVRVNATSSPPDTGAVDLIFLWVKAYDTQEAVESSRPLLAPHTEVVSLQNGWGNVEAIVRVTGPRRAIGGITSLGATWRDAGRVLYAGTGDTVIGRPAGRMDGLERVAGLLSGAGIPTRISPDIEDAIWSKLIINAAINPLTALTRLKNGQLLEREDTRRLLDAVVDESQEIVLRSGGALIYPDIRRQTRTVCERTAPNTSSMLQDVLRGRRTEIDAINGALVKRAQAVDAGAPINEMLTCLVKAVSEGNR